MKTAKRSVKTAKKHSPATKQVSAPAGINIDQLKELISYAADEWAATMAERDKRMMREARAMISELYAKLRPSTEPLEAPAAPDLKIVDDDFAPASNGTASAAEPGDCVEAGVSGLESPEDDIA